MNVEQHIKTVRIPGIISKIEYFDHFLSKELYSTKIKGIGSSYVISHHKINTGQHDITVEVYTSETIVIKGSPRIPLDEFEKIASKVIEIANRSKLSVADDRPITLTRAIGIMSYALKLDLSDEYQRMVAVILSDLVNEIILTEIMRNQGIKGSPLEAGVPTKIRYLKEKNISIYLEEEIKNIRDLRNGVAHRGEFPDETQAKQAIDVAHKVLKWILSEKEES